MENQQDRVIQTPGNEHVSKEGNSAEPTEEPGPSSTAQKEDSQNKEPEEDESTALEEEITRKSGW